MLLLSQLLRGRLGLFQPSWPIRVCTKDEEPEDGSALVSENGGTAIAALYSLAWGLTCMKISYSV